MGLTSHGLTELINSGLPAWIIAGLVVVALIAHYGPKWLEVILKDRRETRRIINDDKRKNEKHKLDIEEKISKINERQNKLERQRAGKKP